MKVSGSAWSTISRPAACPTWPISRVATSGPRGVWPISRSASGPWRAWIMCSTRRRFPSVPRSVQEPLASHTSGPTATINMLEAARQAGVRRFMFAASSSAYGDTIELPKHEDILPHPLSPYAAGKLAGEHYVRVYAETMGLDGVSLRYFNIFGPRQDPSSPYSGVISIFIEKMARGERPTIYGDGSQTRDFTYVVNAVAANLAAMRHPQPLGGAVFNVGSGQSIQLLDLVAALNTIFKRNLEPDFQPPRAGDVRDSLASLVRINQALGYRPLVSFEEGLRRTVEASAPWNLP